jgi:two-component system, OmpR family, response regulator AdeR
MFQGRRILIAEDEPEISEVLDVFLVADGFRTKIARDGRSAIHLWQTTRPDLILLDIRLPVLDGLDVLAAVRRAGETPVIMATAMVDDVDRLRGLDMGADDYIVKPFNPKEVVARVKAVLRRVLPRGAGSMVRLGEIELNAEAHGVKVNGAALALTRTEFRLLAHMFAQPKRVFSRVELMDACMSSSEASDRAVDNHLSALRKKLEAADAAGWISAVRGVGYRLRTDL